MKKILSLLLICSCLAGFGQTVPLTTVEIPTSADDLNRPGGGAEQWTFGQNIINIPNQSTSTTRVTAYFRYPWYAIQSPNATGPGLNMDFSQFDRDMQDAITKGQITGFGYLVNFGDQAPSIGGAKRVYPQALHAAMQAEGVHDFINGGYWYENPNSAAWLSWLTGLFNATAAHINSTSFNGVPYSSVVKYVDIRIIGDFGEGAVLGVGPTPTSTACNAIIDAYKAAFHQFYLTAMIGNFSGGQPGPTGIGITPLATSTYLLKTVTDKGPVGWRRDNYGQVDSYIRNWTDLNPVVDAGYHYDTAIQNRYRQSPVRGEPQDGGCGLSCGSGAGNFEDFVTQVTRDHTQTFGNGNFNGAVNATIQNNFRAASKASGYRLVPNGGNITQNLIAGGAFTIGLNWKNVNGIPTYETWNAIYEIKNSAGTVMQRFTSAFKPYLFRSTTNVLTTDNFTLTTVPAGTGYILSVRVEDPLNYMKPMPLFINGRDASGAYPLLTNFTVTSSGTVANAGANQTVIIPNVTLNSSLSVGATTRIWTRLSGPNTPTITTPTGITTTVTGLITGVYVFQVAINGGSAPPLTSTVTITVNLPVPTANAGPNQNIIVPTVNLTAAASTNYTTVLWTRISGPNVPSITTPAGVTTTVTGLINGTYVFQVAVNGGTVVPQIAQVTIVVAIPPVVANAGANQAIALPTTSTTVNGSGSSGPIVTYAWSNVSGPNTPVITTPATVSTTVTGLIAGVYIIRLTLNGVVTDDIQITVSAAPVASAGPDKIVQLPISTVNVSAAGSTSAVTYAWTKISGPGTPTIVTPTAVSTNITGLLAGVYVYRVTINGGSTDDVTITVNAVPAVANAGNNQSITLPISTVTLNGSGSTGVSSWAWTLISGPNVPTITNPGLGITTVTGLIAGTYVFQLSINGGVSTSQATVVVFPAPLPVANAGSNQTITLPINTALLNGSGSSGIITSYLWTRTSGPSTPVITTPTSATAGAANLIQGTYVFDLSLNGGAVHAQTTVTVLPAPLPVPNAGPSQTITLPTSIVTLNSILSTGVISTYNWSLVSGPSTPTIATPNGATTALSNLVTGIYLMRLTLNGGPTDTMRVYVNPIPPIGSALTVFTTQIPPAGGVTLNDGVALEVGMKFQTLINTYVMGARFYKTIGNTGVHIAELYSYPANVRLAQATFTSETQSGWQVAQFTTPVKISPGQTYIIAYWSSLGNYTSTNGYFTTAVTNSPLIGMASAAPGNPNGVYRYTNTPAIPNSYYSDHQPNYWVDPITNPTPPEYLIRTGFRKIIYIEGN